MDKKTIANKIRRALFDKNMTQLEFAKKLNVSRNVVSQWVTGRNIPPGDKMLLIAKELDLVTELFPEYKKIEKSVDINIIYHK